VQYYTKLTVNIIKRSTYILFFIRIATYRVADRLNVITFDIRPLKYDLNTSKDKPRETTADVCQSIQINMAH